MNHIRLLVIGTMLMFALPMVARQTAAQPEGSAQHEDSGASVPAVEKHLNVLTEKLGLTADQQVRAKPILQEMQDASNKLTQDESMSPEERMENVKMARFKAARKLREILNDEQKKKLDQLEQEAHHEHGHELHGDANGAAPKSPSAP